uniref:Peptidase S1 domain-containing protein n=1 Tax=Trichogramma kaykai TaxID=54128 RepID=A0ABD2XCG2_9HYME
MKKLEKIYFCFFIAFFVFKDCGAVFKGQEAKIEDFPYQVSIQNSDGNNHFCGGVIIDRRHVLTAAHCLYGFEPEDFKVVAGVSNLKLPGSVYLVSDLFVHEGFAFNRPAINDIALLRVNASFQFSDVVKPAKLSMARRAYVPSRNSILYISGYGRDNLHSWSSKLLRKGELRITHVRLCEKYFKKHNYYQPQNQLCTKEKITGRGGLSVSRASPWKDAPVQVIHPCSPKSHRTLKKDTQCAENFMQPLRKATRRSKYVYIYDLL